LAVIQNRWQVVLTAPMAVSYDLNYSIVESDRIFVDLLVAAVPAADTILNHSNLKYVNNNHLK
jgi:hypothetical protein